MNVYDALEAIAKIVLCATAANACWSVVSAANSLKALAKSQQELLALLQKSLRDQP